MIKIFSYGTLIDRDVQIFEFGQEFMVSSDIDVVVGWSRVKLDGGNYYNYDYLNVVNTKKDNRDFNLMYYFIQKEYKSIKDQIK
jgi:uncharacterized protein YycO